MTILSRLICSVAGHRIKDLTGRLWCARCEQFIEPKEADPHLSPPRPSGLTTMLKRISDTEFIRKSRKGIKFYTLPTLIGTLLVSLAALGVTRSTLASWDAIEEKGGIIRERQYQLFRVDIMIAALTTWYAFISPAWQHAKEKVKESETKEPPA